MFQLAQFIRYICASIQSFSPTSKLWDVAFRIDKNNVFGILRFETRSRQENLGVEGIFCASSKISTPTSALESISYIELSGRRVPDYSITLLMYYINRTVRYV